MPSIPVAGVKPVAPAREPMPDIGTKAVQVT